MLTENQRQRVVALRRALHDFPERSGQERRTMAAIQAFLSQNTALAVRDMGGWLLATHWEGDGLPAVGFRADMDALPACNEIGARHGCGHDGHSAMLCGLGLMLEGRRVGRNVHLIFQAAEETGEGAKRVIDTWRALRTLDAIYALHNIPGHPKGTLLMRRGCFACASCGHIVHMTGRPAHAAYPGDGANPIGPLCRLTLEIPEMIADILAGSDRLLMRTLIGLNAGGEDFGISAHEGRLCQTLRGHRKGDIDALIQRTEACARASCRETGMKCDFEIRDAFPDTTNDDALFDAAMNRFQAANLPVRLLGEPMRWSEDFGWLLREAPGVYFGIGAGESCPGLHTEGYAFDDDLIETGVRAFGALLGL